MTRVGKWLFPLLAALVLGVSTAHARLTQPNLPPAPAVTQADCYDTQQDAAQSYPDLQPPPLVYVPESCVVAEYPPLPGDILLARDFLGRIWFMRVEYAEVHNGEFCYALSPLGLCAESPSPWAFWNPNSTMGSEFVSIGDAFGSAAANTWGWFTMDKDLQNAASSTFQNSINGSGVANLDKVNAPDWAYNAYWGSVGVSAGSSLALGGAMVTEGVVSEIGAKAFSRAGWDAINAEMPGFAEMSNYEKGLSLIKNQGFFQAAMPTGAGFKLGIGTAAFGQGPTAGAWILGVPAAATVGRAAYGMSLWIGDQF